MCVGDSNRQPLFLNHKSHNEWTGFLLLLAGFVRLDGIRVPV